MTDTFGGYATFAEYHAAQNIERARESLREAREALEALQFHMRELGEWVRQIDPGEYERVDAYPGWNVTRDMGCGTDLEGWLTEIEESIDAHSPHDHDWEESYECDGRTWHTCRVCDLTEKVGA